MKALRLSVVLACLSLLFLSCQKENSNGTENVTGNAGVSVVVAEFPSFEQNVKANGQADPGKTEWVAGDNILLQVADQKITLTYSGDGNWTADPVITAENSEVEIMALYAPDYEWQSEDIVLKAGKTAGCCEYISYTRTAAVTNENPIVIDFKEAERNYSRLRIVTRVNSGVTLSGDFVPLNGVMPAEGIRLESDSNGNAFAYGSFGENAVLTVNSVYGQSSRTVSNSSVPQKSYALDARIDANGTPLPGTPTVYVKAVEGFKWADFGLYGDYYVNGNPQPAMGAWPGRKPDGTRTFGSHTFKFFVLDPVAEGRGVDLQLTSSEGSFRGVYVTVDRELFFTVNNDEWKWSQNGMVDSQRGYSVCIRDYANWGQPYLYAFYSESAQKREPFGGWPGLHSSSGDVVTIEIKNADNSIKCKEYLFYTGINTGSPDITFILNNNNGSQTNDFNAGPLDGNRFYKVIYENNQWNWYVWD